MAIRQDVTPRTVEVAEFDASQAMFNSQLATYRKVTRENLMFHREVYDLLHKVLVAEAPRPFGFLDVACGDASASAKMLAGTAVGHYSGIDLSSRSLDLARKTLMSLPCEVNLHCCDFVEALADWVGPLDVVWIGMSLHHLQLPEKLRCMKNIHRALRGTGLFLIWEPTLFNGEDRSAWLQRFSALRSIWAAMTDDEFEAMEGHMRIADFPEKAETWMAMGREAGFGQAEELYVMPNRMGRVFKYRN